MEEALEIVGRLLDGERLDHEGRLWRLRGRIRTRARSAVRPSTCRRSDQTPRRWPAAWATGYGRSPDPETAPDLIDAYRAACDDAGREPGEVILQTGFSWAQHDDAALEGARAWKPTQLDENFTDDIHDARATAEKADDEVSDEEFMQSYIVSGDPAAHVERIREIESMGATVVCLQNGSGADPPARCGPTARACCLP